MRCSTGSFSGSRRGTSRNCSGFTAMSGRPPQVLEQRLDRRGLRLDDPELAHEGAEIVEHLLAPGARGLAHVRFDQVTQVLQMRLHPLGRDAVNVYELVVVAIDEAAIEIEHIREATGEPGTEVESRASEHADDATGHVLAAVIAGSLDDRDRAGVAHREALAGLASGIELTARCAVQAGVAHDHGIARGERQAARRLENDLAGGHALADVVVGIAFEIEMQATRIPRPETLPDRAAQL